MGEGEQSVYQVCVQPDCVFIRICGRASYVNCEPIRRFLTKALEGGKEKIVLDFKECGGVDSTFLGILVGVALELRGREDGGSMTLLRLGERNLETVRNLGIDRIAEVAEQDDLPESGLMEELEGEETSTSRKEVYEAHKRLMALSSDNARKFHDVVTFLEQRLAEEGVSDEAT